MRLITRFPSRESIKPPESDRKRVTRFDDSCRCNHMPSSWKRHESLKSQVNTWRVPLIRENKNKVTLERRVAPCENFAGSGDVDLRSNRPGVRHDKFLFPSVPPGRDEIINIWKRFP